MVRLRDWDPFLLQQRALAIVDPNNSWQSSRVVPNRGGYNAKSSARSLPRIPLSSMGTRVIG